MKDICLEFAGGVEQKLALVSEILGAAGVNIEGLCITKTEDSAVVHYLVGDEKTAIRILRSAGVEIVKISEVFVLNKDKDGITGKPGSFGRICRTLADSGVGIDFGYPAENNRFVFGVKDVEKVRELLK